MTDKEGSHLLALLKQDTSNRLETRKADSALEVVDPHLTNNSFTLNDPKSRILNLVFHGLKGFKYESTPFYFKKLDAF